jgi:hypothetical protein
MKTNIFLALLEKNALGVDNIVTASYNVTDMFGRTFKRTSDFKISNIQSNQARIFFDLIAINENKSIRLSEESIVYIDGMDVPRYADIYDLLPDGTSKKVGKKRGRKSKNHAMK